MTTPHDTDERDARLDAILDEIRAERPDPSFEHAVLGRVWQNVAGAAEEHDPARPHRIESCADFQRLIPGFLEERLPPARRLLLEDHLGECVPCRRALGARRKPAARVESVRPNRVAAWGWRAAAAAAVFLALVGFSWKTALFSFESGGLIRIKAVDGELYRVTGDRAVPLRPGDELTLGPGEDLRTAMGSSALISLADASTVELRERSELAVHERRYLFPGRRADGVIDLDRGSIIVEASDQGSGHLFVDTRDCNVSVTGTVFAVSSGTKGARVSVVEGEVHVQQRGAEEVLHPGDQTTTQPTLDRIPVEQDVAWSRNSAEYVALLREFRALGREIDAALQPELRDGTELLDIAPAGTAVYFAIPNMSDELARAYGMLQDRIATSVVLQNWWNDVVLASGEGGRIEEIIERIRTFGEYLGGEIVMTLQLAPDGRVEPLFVARVSDAAAFKAHVAGEIAEIESELGRPGTFRLIEGELPSAAAPDPEGLCFWIRGDVLAVAPTVEPFRALERSLGGEEGARFFGSSLHTRLSELYAGGVEWVVGVDLERLLSVDPSVREHLEPLGLSDVQHLIGERLERDGRTENRVALIFDRPRRSLAAWLAEPAPIGALDYVGPEANLAGAFAMKDMEVVVKELLQLVDQETLDRFQHEERIDLLRDVASPLGGELAVALDGPVLPTPSWKVILEVYDPAKLVGTIEWLVGRINQEAQEHSGTAALTLERETVGDREYFRLGSTAAPLTVHFTFDDGYLVAGPSRSLIDRAIANRAAGVRLIDSANFLGQLPRDSEVDFSGMLYQNLGSILDPAAETLKTVGGLDEGQRQALGLAAGSGPSLALLYGRPDRITLSSSSEGGLFGSMLNQLSGVTGLLRVTQSMAQAPAEPREAR